MIGFKDPSILYLIDFGLTTRYLKDDGTHIEKENLGSFCGNFLFASINTCRGNNKSRRDDMQSAMYLMIYLMNGNKLPWSNFGTVFKDYTFGEYLNERL